MGGCCETNYRKSQDFLFGVSEKNAFCFKDVVPIKYHHYLKEYEFEKNLPSVKERTKISLLKNRVSGKRYVCKSISYYNPQSEKAILQEVDLLSKLDHPNIPKIIEVFIYQSTAHIVKEQTIFKLLIFSIRFCRGGFLTQWLSNNKNLSEKMIISLVKQLLSAINYLHNECIVHREIRLTSVLINTDKQGNVYIQLMSFDNAVQLSYRDQNLTNVLPGMEFTAPEIFIGKYDRKIDEYAAGVLMYYLLSGQEFPFKLSSQNNDKEQFWGLMSQELQFNHQVWSNYENILLIKEVLEGLLNRDMTKRWSAKKALKHDLFKHTQTEIQQDISQNLIRDNMQFRPTIKRRRMNIIKRGMLLYIATRLLPEQRYGELTQLFQVLDSNGDGYLLKDSLKQQLKPQYGENSQVLRDLDKMFHLFADKRTGKINFSDFIAAMIELRGEVDDNIIKKTFCMISGNDENKNVTRQQLFDTIKNSSTNANKAKEFVKQMDKTIDKFQIQKVGNGFNDTSKTTNDNEQTNTGFLNRLNTIDRKNTIQEERIISFDTFRKIMKQQ
eukprot:403375425